MERMKKFKKAAIALCLAIVVIAPILVFADVPPTFYVEVSGGNTEFSRGDTVTVLIKIKDAGTDSYNGWTYALNYDPDMLEYVSCRATPSDEDHDYTTACEDGQSKTEDGKRVVKFSGAESSGTLVSFNGQLGRAVFKVKNTAAGLSSLNINVEDFIKKTPEIDEKITDFRTENVNISVDVPATGITLESSSLVLENGSTQTIVVNPTPSDTTTPKNATYTVTSGSSVTVDNSTGVITTVANGESTITVNAYGYTKTMTVNVINPITEITLDKNTLSLNKGANETLTATLVRPNPSAPATGANTVTWESTNSEVATVDSTGKVTAVKGGTTTIRAKISDELVAECTVTVVVPLTDATIDKNNLSMGRGDTENLTITLTPDDATDVPEIEWTSGDTSVVTITKNSNTSVTVTAVAGGRTNITAKIGDFKTFTIPVVVNVPIQSIDMAQSSVQVLKGKTIDLTLNFTPSDTSEKDSIIWSSSDASIATVDQNGKVTGVEPGTVTITATDGGTHTATATVKVLKPITGVAINPVDNFELARGENRTLSAVVTPDDAEEDKTVTWTSSDASIVSVDQTGMITANAIGTATITAKAGEFTATVDVTVVVPITGIAFDKAETTLSKGESETLNLTINPSDTTEDKTVTWTSSANDVASVVNGVVTANKAGSAVITAQVGSHTATMTVNVVVPITSVTIDQTNSITLNKNATTTLTATVNPTDATEDKTVIWTSLTPDIASVDENGIVTALKGGTARIQAQAGSKTAVKEIEVVVPITDFTASSTLEIYRGVGREQKISTVITPSDTTENKTITWTSSDNTVAKVDANGIVTGLKEGTATITGTLANGMSVQVEVTVKIIPLTDIDVVIPDEILKGTKNATSIKVTPTPSDTTEFENVEFTSSDEDVITFDEDGRMVGLKEGTATITVKVGTIEKEFEVNVKEIHAESIEVVLPLEDLKDLTPGKSFVLSVGLTPNNATDEFSFEFLSSNEDILTVDENGVVTLVGVGTATITVTADNGYQATYTLTVNEAAKEESKDENKTSPKTGVESVISNIIISITSLSLIGFVGYRRFKPER